MAFAIPFFVDWEWLRDIERCILMGYYNEPCKPGSIAPYIKPINNVVLWQNLPVVKIPSSKQWEPHLAVNNHDETLSNEALARTHIKTDRTNFTAHPTSKDPKGICQGILQGIPKGIPSKSPSAIGCRKTQVSSSCIQLSNKISPWKGCCRREFRLTSGTSHHQTYTGKTSANPSLPSTWYVCLRWQRAISVVLWKFMKIHWAGHPVQWRWVQDSVKCADAYLVSEQSWWKG